MFDQQFREAERLITQQMMAKPATQGAFQPVGDLLLTFPKFATAENYRRELNLKTATAISQFTSDGVTYTRELFCSGPDNVLVLRLTASKPGMISFKLSMQTGQPNPQSEGADDTLIVTGNNRGFSGNGVNVPAALKYQVRAKILPNGGKVTKGTRVIMPPPAATAPATAPAGRGFGRGGRGNIPQDTQIPLEYSVEGADGSDDSGCHRHELQELSRHLTRSGVMLWRNCRHH